MRKTITMVLVLILTGSFFTLGFAQTPEDSLKKAFPKLKFNSIHPSNITGVYEITTGNEILYYYPETESIIVGEIITKDGRSLTREKQQELLSKNIKEKIKDVPLQKALSIGQGKHRIIEITDPDCPYCRKASEFFFKRIDVTRHIFFYPLPIHPQAKDKVLYIFCAKDMAKAYEEAMTGKLDDMTFKICKDPKALELLNIHKDVADRLGVKGTPFFFIDGHTAVFGADVPRLDKLLRDGQ
jgi:thiol:disulfide interchange protein DsbC